MRDEHDPTSSILEFLTFGGLSIGWWSIISMTFTEKNYTKNLAQLTLFLNKQNAYLGFSWEQIVGQ